MGDNNFMIIHLRQNASGKMLLVVLAFILLSLFMSFLLFEVFDIDGSNTLPFYWLEEGLVLEATTLHRNLLHLFAQHAALWAELFISLLMLTPLIDRTRKRRLFSLSRAPMPVFCQRLLARSNLSPEAASLLF